MSDHEHETIKDDQTTIQTVHRRLIFYVPGFDPNPPRRYRELYRTEGKKQAAWSGYSLNINPMPRHGKTYRFGITADIDGTKTESEMRFFSWNDLVDDFLELNMVTSWKLAFQAIWTYISSGAYAKLWNLRRATIITTTFPYFFLILQYLGAIALTVLTVSILGPLISKPFALPFGLIFGIWWLLWWRRHDSLTMTYYLMHDYAYSVNEKGRTPAPLRRRLAAFKYELAESLNEGFDEILIVGHSSGAHLAALVLRDLIGHNIIQTKHHVSFLSVGHAIPMVSFLPTASDVRGAMYDLARQNTVPWIDVTAPSDGAAFSLVDPVASVGAAPDEGDYYPKILSATFSQTLSPKLYRSIKYRFFRVHFQYLCAFDRPRDYDYFKITAGPRKLWERLGHLNDSPSADRRVLSPYQSRDPLIDNPFGYD